MKTMKTEHLQPAHNSKGKNMSTLIEITQQDKALLSLIAAGESTGVRGDPYTALWPSSTEPSLIRMSLAQVTQFQRSRIRAGFKSTACGRYQFIKDMMDKSYKYGPFVKNGLTCGRFVYKVVNKSNASVTDKFRTTLFDMLMRIKFFEKICLRFYYKKVS